MNRVEAAGGNWIVSSVKKTVRVRAVPGVADGFPTPGDGLERQIDQEAVGEGLAGKQRRFLSVGIFSNPADAIHRRGNRRDESARARTAENTIEAAEAGGVAKGGSGVGVGSDKSASDANYGDGGPDMLALGQFRGKQPDIFLVGQNISWQLAKRYAAASVRAACGRPGACGGRGGFWRVGLFLGAQRKGTDQKSHEHEGDVLVISRRKCHSPILVQTAGERVFHTVQLSQTV